VYEREGIEQWLNDHDTSPVTGATIGKNVVASTSIKNHIETLIENFELTHDDDKSLVSNWKNRLEAIKKKKMDALIRKAESGDVKSMEKLGKNYQDGLDGFDVDEEKGYKWNKCAADNGSIRGLHRCGTYLLALKPNRSVSDKLQGVSLMSLAATEKGSSYACLVLGIWYGKGQFGLPKDKGQAVRLLKLGLSGKCQHDYVKQSTVDDATKTLQELTPAEVEVLV
jgi:TPR repeat protein